MKEGDYEAAVIALNLARLAKGRPQKEIADDANVSTSHLSDLFRGIAKDPKLSTIKRVAKALGVEPQAIYELPSDMRFLEGIPDDLFIGTSPPVSKAKIVTLIREDPAAGAAFLRVLTEVARLHGLRDEELPRTMLRVYQRDAYARATEGGDELSAVEERAERVRKELVERYGWDGEASVESREATLRRALAEGATGEGGAGPRYIIDEKGWPKEGRGGESPLTGFKSMFVEGGRPVLFINPRLEPAQRLFIWAREIGFYHLGLVGKSSSLYPPPRKASFEELKNSFMANHFAGALLLPRRTFVGDLRRVLEGEGWDPDTFMRSFRGLRPEVAFYRLVAVAHDLGAEEYSFVRRNYRLAYGRPRIEVQGDHQALALPVMPPVTKNISVFERLPSIDRKGTEEHGCMLWGGVASIAKLLHDAGEGAAVAGRVPIRDTTVTPPLGILAHAQISRTLGLRFRDPSTAPSFLVLSVAYSLHARMNEVASVSFSVRLDNARVRERWRRLLDSLGDEEVVALSCERCGRFPCAVRRAEPTILDQHLRRDTRIAAMKRLQERARALGKG